MKIFSLSNSEWRASHWISPIIPQTFHQRQHDQTLYTFSSHPIVPTLDLNPRKLVCRWRSTTDRIAHTPDNWRAWEELMDFAIPTQRRHVHCCYCCNDYCNQILEVGGGWERHWKLLRPIRWLYWSFSIDMMSVDGRFVKISLLWNRNRLFLCHSCLLTWIIWYSFLLLISCHVWMSSNESSSLGFTLMTILVLLLFCFVKSFMKNSPMFSFAFSLSWGVVDFGK